MVEKDEKKKGKAAADEEAAAPAAEGEEKKEKKEKGKKKREGAPAKKVVSDNPDFRHLVRLAATDLAGGKQVVIALQGIRGVGKRISYVIADKAAVPRFSKIGDLADPQIQALDAALQNFIETSPGWIFNRQHDYDTGDNTHLIGTNVEIFLREDINRLKKVRTYRGVRHEAGLPVRGQRTRSNGRVGMTVGVLRKKEGAPGAEKKEEKGEKKAEKPAAAAKPAAGAAKPAAGAGAKPAAAAPKKEAKK